VILGDYSDGPYPGTSLAGIYQCLTSPGRIEKAHVHVLYELSILGRDFHMLGTKKSGRANGKVRVYRQSGISIYLSTGVLNICKTTSRDLRPTTDIITQQVLKTFLSKTIKNLKRYRSDLDSYVLMLLRDGTVWIEATTIENIVCIIPA
jgi:hypothetical protein